MTPDEAFIQAIRDAPDDDAPRLVYADWLEEHGRPGRAEFIRLQCELARGGGDEARRAALRARTAELLVAHGAEWVAPLRRILRRDDASLVYMHAWLGAVGPPVVDLFQRGFIECLKLTAAGFTANAAELVRHSPFVELWLHGAGRHGRALAATSQLEEVRCLRFGDYFRDPLTAEGARALAASPHLGRLKELWLYRNDIGDAGVEALAAAPWLLGLRHLDLQENGLSAAAVSALTAWGSRQLAWLSLANNPVGDEGLIALANSALLGGVRSLWLSRCGIGDAGVTALAASPRAAGLCSLDLARNQITDRGAEALARSPHLGQLKNLTLNDNPLSWPPRRPWPVPRHSRG
jgi:uncharacterized protein (TIGR02996 family)